MRHDRAIGTGGRVAHASTVISQRRLRHWCQRHRLAHGHRSGRRTNARHAQLGLRRRTNANSRPLLHVGLILRRTRRQHQECTSCHRLVVRRDEVTDVPRSREQCTRVDAERRPRAEALEHVAALVISNGQPSHRQIGTCLVELFHFSVGLSSLGRPIELVEFFELRLTLRLEDFTCVSNHADRRVVPRRAILARCPTRRFRQRLVGEQNALVRLTILARCAVGRDALAFVASVGLHIRGTVLLDVLFVLFGPFWDIVALAAEFLAAAFQSCNSLLHGHERAARSAGLLNEMVAVTTEHLDHVRDVLVAVQTMSRVNRRENRRRIRCNCRRAFEQHHHDLTDALADARGRRDRVQSVVLVEPPLGLDRRDDLRSCVTARDLHFAVRLTQFVLRLPSIERRCRHDPREDSDAVTDFDSAVQKILVLLQQAVELDHRTEQVGYSPELSISAV